MDHDTSSTMTYQRDNVYIFQIFFHLPFFRRKKTLFYTFLMKKKEAYIRLTFGEYIFLAFCIAMCFVNLKVTLMIYIIPFVFARLVMMLGNWTQHALWIASNLIICIKVL